MSRMTTKGKLEKGQINQLLDDGMEFQRQAMGVAHMRQELQATGWMVAAHNEYRQDGQIMVFWLFANGIYAAKGEGLTDYEALRQVQVEVARIERHMGG